MGNLAWDQQRLTRVQEEPLCSHLKLELAFEDIEPFLQLVMQVTWWATFRHEGVLHDEHIAWVRRGHLEGKGDTALVALFAKAILARCDEKCGWDASTVLASVGSLMRNSFLQSWHCQFFFFVATDASPDMDNGGDAADQSNLSCLSV